MAATKTPAKAPKTASSTRTKSANAGKKTDRANLLSVKRQLRRTRPKFTRHRPDRKASLDERWKKPRGLHNKLKDRKRGCAAWVSQGYRTPTAMRGTHVSGLMIAHVANVKELALVNPETHGIVLASVGAKRQLELLAAAKEKGVRVLNHKADERVKELNERFSSAKAVREAQRAAASAKTAAKTDKKAKVDAKAAKAAEQTEEEKRDAQEEIKKEVLTSKNQQ